MAQQTPNSSYSGIPRATTYNKNVTPLKLPARTLTKRASVVNFQRPQPWVPANTVTPPLTPQTSDDNLYMNMAPSPREATTAMTTMHQQQQQHQQLSSSSLQRQEHDRQQQLQQQQQNEYEQQQQQQQQQWQLQLQQQQQQAAPFAEYWRAFYGYYPAYDAQSSTVTLPLNAGDLVLVHSIHDNGWADGTLLSSGIRGWFPTNYCEPYDPEPIRNLLKALTNFFDIVRSGAEGNVAVFCNQDYMRLLVAGVRSLLDKTQCLTRESPMVSAYLALSRSRKSLLSDLSVLVKIAKSLQAELTATHAQPELEESCIDDMVLRAFKLVTRAVKFHDIWQQALLEEAVDSGVVGEPFRPASVTPSLYRDEQFSRTGSFTPDLGSTFGGAAAAAVTTAGDGSFSTTYSGSFSGAVNPRTSDTLTDSRAISQASNHPGCGADSATADANSDAVTRQSVTTSGAFASHEGDSTSPNRHRYSVTHNQSPALHQQQQVSPQSLFHRMSINRRTPSVHYSNHVRPQTSQSQTRFSFSNNSRPSSVAVTPTLGAPGNGFGNNSNRHSVSHRISIASRLDGVSRENLASERLTQAHENLLTSLGAFIGIHVSSRTSQELLATTQECLDGTESLTQILRAIWERGYFGSESIDEIEEVMFAHISHLVDAVQDIFHSLSQADEDGYNMEVDFPTGDRRQLTDAATICIRAAGEAVSKGRYVMEMIGDFEFEHEPARQSLFDGTLLASSPHDVAEKEEDEKEQQEHERREGEPASATLADSRLARQEPEGGAQQETDEPLAVSPTSQTAPQTEPPRPASSHRPLSSHRLSAFATTPQPSYEPPAVPAASLRIDTTRPSLEQSGGGDAAPPTDRISNGSWLPPLPKLTSPMIGSELIDGFSSRHSFLQVGDGQEIQISPRSDSLRGSSILSGTTVAESKRGSERSSVSMTSTRATSPDVHADESQRTTLIATSSATTITNATDDEQQNIEDEELDEKVLEKTYVHELVFNKEGQITGGTLPALVERLTIADSTPDPVFVSTFFLTFRLFATPREFAQTLIDRFTYSSESQDAASSVQLRVYNAFKLWLETHWRFEVDEPALDLIVSFSTGSLTQVLPSAGRQLFDLANQVNMTSSSPSMHSSSRLASGAGKGNTILSTSAAAAAAAPGTPMPSPSINKSQTNLLKLWHGGRAMPNITDFEPLELARQFTLKVSSTFCNIMPEELLGIEWTKKSGSVAVNVRALSTLSTDLANLVAECVLGQEDAGKRAKVIKHWVKIAKCCLELSNYDSLIAIVCSLNSTTILRLKKTWEAVSTKTKATLGQLNSAVDCSKNYSQLRGILAGAAPPCLPFLGMYLTDLTFVDAGNPNVRTTTEGTRLINFDKHVKTARIINELQRFQIPYRFQEISEMQTWIQESLVRVRSNEESGQAGGQAYYRRSLLLEPRTEGRGMPGAPSPALSQGGWSPTDDKPKGGMKDFQSMLRGVMKRENSHYNSSSVEGSRRPSLAGQE